MIQLKLAFKNYIIGKEKDVLVTSAYLGELFKVKINPLLREPLDLETNGLFDDFKIFIVANDFGFRSMGDFGQNRLFHIQERYIPANLKLYFNSTETDEFGNRIG